MPGETPLLEVRGLHKSYAAPVLIDVDLTIGRGEIHALVGANGAGKSTLSRIISGLTLRDAGTIVLGGRPYVATTKAEAEAAGVQMVMQELNLVPTLSVAENLFLNRLPRRAGFVDFVRLREEAREALKKVGLESVDPAIAVSRLGVGRQQLVEIASALARPCRLLILDEPTAALTDPEIDLLFDNARRLRRAGVGILYISHRMEEIRRIADRVTVLRDGQVVASRSVAGFTVAEIVEAMVGGEILEPLDVDERPSGPVALRVEGLRRATHVRDVSFEVRRGEILGFAGLVGSGRTETLRAVFGADPTEGGRVLRDGAPVGISHPRDAVRAGIGMIPEDRKQQALLLPQSVRVNTTLADVRRAAGSPGWIDRSRETEIVERFRRDLAVQARSVEQPVEELSGGNQQKVVLARWLLRDCEVLLFDEPTRGIDVGAKQLVYGLLRDLAARGKALVLVSSELRDLMAICDRIAVLSDGRIAATFERGEWSKERIMSAAISEYVTRSAAE